MLRGILKAVVLLFFMTFLGGSAWGAGGDLLWQVASGGGVLAASNGRVVVAGAAGVQTFDGKSGTILWHDSFSGATTVAMDAQQVIVVGASAIRAYRVKDGFLDWQDALASGTVIAAVEMKGKQLLVAGSATDSSGVVQLLIRAYDARNGQIEWEDQSLPPNTTFTTGFSLGQKSLSIFGNRAYVVATVGVGPNFTARCLVGAYDRNGGNRVWESVSNETCRAKAVAAHQKQVILAGIGGAGNDDFLVRSYDAQTGQLLWQDRTFVSTGFDNEAVAVDEKGKRAFVAGWVRWIPGTGNQEAFLVRAYNMQTGELYWEDQYPGPGGLCLCHALDVVVEGGRVFAVGNSSFSPFIVRAYGARSGSLLWQDALFSGGLTASVAVDRGVVFATDTAVLRAYAAGM